MKKHICIILLAALLLLCACQPTPESPIVVGKDQSAMIEKAQEDSPYASPETGEQAVDWYARLNAPERYTTSLTSAGGHLTVEVDAPVILPDVELPVVHVTPTRFSDEDAKRFVKAFFGDDPQCIPSDGNNMTKAVYNRMILQMRDDIDHWAEYGNVIWGQYDTKEECEKALQQLMMKASEAPDSLETSAPVYEWKPIIWQGMTGEQDYGERSMEILTLNEDGTRSRLRIIDGAKIMHSQIVYTRDVDGGLDYWDDDASQWPNEVKITENEARLLAEKTLHEMGFDHLVCALSKTTRSYHGGTVREDIPYRPCWAFVFTPEVNGAALTYTYRSFVEATEYSYSWAYERCYVLVDEQGIASLEYYDLCSPDEITVEASALLPFETIIEIFEKMVLIVDNSADTLGRDFSYQISSVRLGMVSIPERNGEGGYMVPCWDFMGDPFPMDSFPEFWQKMGWKQDGSNSFLTINAIDGSIIARQ